MREGFESRENENERLYDFMRRTIAVAGKPFSQANHLTVLENDSYDWDLEETPLHTKLALIEHAQVLHGVDRGYNVPHFVTGFEAMVQDLKASGQQIESTVEKQKMRAQDTVSADFGPT